MSLPTLINPETAQPLPIHELSITGQAENETLSLQIDIFYHNLKSEKIPTTFCPQTLGIYRFRDWSVSVNDKSVVPIQAVHSIPLKNTNSLNEALLSAKEHEPENSSIGYINPNEVCRLSMTLSLQGGINHDLSGEMAETTHIVLPFTIPVNRVPTPIVNFLEDDAIFQFNLQIRNSFPIMEAYCSDDNCKWIPSSFTSGELRLSQRFQGPNLAITLQSNEAQNAPENYSSIFSYNPLPPEDVIQKLLSATEMDPSAKISNLAQASHGFQLFAEQNIRQTLIDQGYPDSLLLGFSETPNAELITCLQPFEWVKNNYKGLFSIYQGRTYNNRLGKWQGRSSTAETVHTFLLSPWSIIFSVCLIISIGVTIFVSLMKKRVSPLIVLVFVFLAAFLAASFARFCTKGNPHFRRVDFLSNITMKSILDEYATLIFPIYEPDIANQPMKFVPTLKWNPLKPTELQIVGHFWIQKFFTPGLEVLSNTLSEMRQNPQHPYYQHAKPFRSVFYLYRYIFPLVFASRDPKMISFAGNLVENFRRVVVYGFIKGCQEIHDSIDRMMMDSFLEADQRIERPWNLRQFTMDIPAIVKLINTILTTFAGSPDPSKRDFYQSYSSFFSGISGEALKEPFERMQILCDKSPCMARFTSLSS